MKKYLKIILSIILCICTIFSCGITSGGYESAGTTGGNSNGSATSKAYGYAISDTTGTKCVGYRFSIVTNKDNQRYKWNNSCKYFLNYYCTGDSTLYGKVKTSKFISPATVRTKFEWAYDYKHDGLTMDTCAYNEFSSSVSKYSDKYTTYKSGTMLSNKVSTAWNSIKYKSGDDGEANAKNVYQILKWMGYSATGNYKNSKTPYNDRVDEVLNNNDNSLLLVMEPIYYVKLNNVMYCLNKKEYRTLTCVIGTRMVRVTGLEPTAS